MAKYIDIEGILSARRIKGELKVHGSLFSRYIPIEALEAMTAADVEPVRHGRWNGEGDGFADGAMVYDVWRCSECDYCIDEGIDDETVLPNYCPNCGAKMDGGVTHEP